jgi:hypothetical protein
MASEAVVGGAAVRRLGRRGARTRPTLAHPATLWDEVLTMPVEITAPDRKSAAALLGEAVSHFRAELVETAGSAALVRLRPTSAAPVGWVFELLALVERWLEAHSLQVANVHYGHRSYVITAPGHERRPNGGPGSASPRVSIDADD